ncbi:EEV protein [Squirrelpox virus]|uniref:Protein OPG161 n=1 Tax=Squirrelpox virus TaxID=240426 RepID=Q1HTR3_9POXV|nr:EEV protein [Squirrelpox virus]ABD51473.1 O8R [Squirrelpox virus]CCD83305.1 EEV protein [Squirrelpox virus]
MADVEQQADTLPLNIPEKPRRHPLAARGMACAIITLRIMVLVSLVSLTTIVAALAVQLRACRQQHEGSACAVTGTPRILPLAQGGGSVSAEECQGIYLDGQCLTRGGDGMVPLQTANTTCHSKGGRLPSQTLIRKDPAGGNQVDWLLFYLQGTWTDEGGHFPSADQTRTKRSTDEDGDDDNTHSEVRGYYCIN